MKFYYNNELIRTSKNHEYTHAVINVETGGCKGCRTSAQACESIISSEIKHHKDYIANLEKKINAIKSGKPYYYETFHGRDYRIPIKQSDTAEEAQERIESLKESMEYIRKNWQIVELERRG